MSSALVVAVFAVLAWQQRWISDDGLIAVREIRQILAGHGPNYNSYQRTEVNTSVLWTWLGVLVALVFRGDIPIDLVGMGLVLSVAGFILALAGSVRFQRTYGRGTRTTGPLVPAGALVVLGVAVFWDFASSGLETGLSLCWIGLLWWLLASTDRESGPRRPAVTSAVIGLGPLVRPDFALISVVFGAALLYLVRPGVRRGLGYVGAAAGLPVGYEIFRAGYYGITVPMPALAKEASNALWERGFVYFHDFYSTYWLLIPQLVLAVPVVVTVIGPTFNRRAAVCLAAPLLSGVLLGAYILRVGGDYMHGRMWIPVTFALLLPVMVVPVGRGHRLESIGVATLVLWAILVGTFAHVPYSGIHLGPRGIVDQRSFEAALFGSEQLWRSDIRLRDQVLRPEFERLTEGGRPTLVLASGRAAGGALWAIPLAPGRPESSGFFFNEMGVAQVVTPLDTIVVDLNGLTTPLGGHLQLNWPGRAGHEKALSPTWVLAAYADPAATDALPDTPDVSEVGVRAARHALSCGSLKELMDSTEQPMTWPRFWANLSGAITRTGLRIPADPAAAEREFCG